jgi:hypothetical protein
MTNSFDMNEMTDDQIMKEFKIGEHWGLSMGVDLERCNMDKINDTNIINDFAIGICDYMGVTPISPLAIKRYDKTPKTSGHSFVQQMELSYITGYFKEFDCGASIDIYLCKPFPPKSVAIFCKKFFNAQKLSIRYVTYRD